MPRLRAGLGRAARIAMWSQGILENEGDGEDGFRARAVA